MYQVNSNMQLCVTCEHYVGPREPYCFLAVKFESTSERGKCYETFPSGVPVYPMGGCPRWRMWGALK